MTRTQLITALLLITIICLGSSALLLPEPADLAPTPAELVGFPPSEVVSVEVALHDGETQHLDRAAPDAWRLRLTGAEGQVTWPASTERVRAFLRILDRLRGMPAETTGEDAKPGPTLTITSETGETATVELPAGAIGGRAVVRVTPGGQDDPSPAWFVTTDELNRLLAPDGMLAWIDARAFAGVGGQVTGVGVNSGGGAMRLERAGASWRIAEPFEAPAEGSLLTELVEGLQTLAIDTPSTDPEAPGADSTVITLTTATRSANPDGTVSTETATHTLRTLGPVTQSGRAPVVLESVDGRGAALAGPIGATIDAARLTEIVRRPSFYIARRVSSASASDVRTLTVTPTDASPLGLKRADAGWAGDAGVLASADSAAVDALVTLLTQTMAAQAEPADAMPAGAQPLATITAHGLGGLAIAEMQLAVAPLPGGGSDGRAHALLLSDGIARYYSPDSAVADAVRWVAGLSAP